MMKLSSVLSNKVNSETNILDHPSKEEAIKGIRAIWEVYTEFLFNPDKKEFGSLNVLNRNI